jgi:anti-sigma factor RsiW
MTEACADRHEDIVDALTGYLSAVRQAEFAAHTGTCAGCAEELRGLGAVASLLHDADVDLEAVERADAPIRLATRSRSVRRRVAVAVLATAAAVVVALPAIGVLRDSSSGSHPDEVALAAKDTAPGASATAELRPQPHGTAIELTCAGLDEGKVYALWLADASGTRTPAGTFVADGDGNASLDTATALPREQAVKIWITDPSDTTVLAAPLT